MKTLVDTNVVLDLLLDREPFVLPASHLFSLIEQGQITGCLGATTITTIHYLATKAVGSKKAREAIDMFLTLFEIAPVTRTVLEDALTDGFPDFEDAVLHEAARHSGAQCIVTRDPIGFRESKLPVYSPDELLRITHK